MSWLDDPELVLFLKEARLAGYKVIDEYARAAPRLYGVLVGDSEVSRLVGIYHDVGSWRVWLGQGPDFRHFDSVEDAIEDVQRRLLEIETS